MAGVHARWAKSVEEEEGIPIHEVIQREKSFGIPHSVIADSFEVGDRTYRAMLDRLRKKGIDV